MTTIDDILFNFCGKSRHLVKFWRRRQWQNSYASYKRHIKSCKLLQTSIIDLDNLCSHIPQLSSDDAIKKIWSDLQFCDFIEYLNDDTDTVTDPKGSRTSGIK